MLRSPSPNPAGRSDWNLNDVLLSKRVLQVTKVRLNVKEWKIFQGETEKGLIYVLT